MTRMMARFGDRLLERMVPKATASAASACQCSRRCCRTMGARAVEGYYIEHCFSGSACTGCTLTGRDC